MEKMTTQMQRFLDCGVMAIIRVDSPETVLPTMEALALGGVDFIEISLVTPNAIDYISQACRKFGETLLVGAGTVLDSESARAAILAGASFIVTPVTKPEVIAITRRYGKLSFVGAYTPTESLTAYEAGASAIKIFPAMPSGPEYLKAIHAPLPQIPLVAVGGITLENLPSFLKAGAVGVAGASNLANPKLAADGRYREITQTAEAWVRAARETRG